MPPPEPSFPDAPTLAQPSPGQRTDLPTLSPTPGSDAPPLAALPGYVILGELGRGGMGVVYKARQVALDRVVAIKMILAGAHASKETLARFQHEAQTIARLQHPNIVQIYEVSEHEGRSFLTLEFIEGGSLAQKTAGVPQEPREAARLIETVARAVQVAHEKGIIHRDMKPGNVLLTADGVPKITDFGLAMEVHGDVRLTATGAILGTPGYMAPEQAAQKDPIGPYTDVHALGAILYELLTGRPPFQAINTFETLMQAMATDPVAPSRLRPGLSRDLDTICLKCLQKEVGKRYASAGELADDLHHFLADEPIRARPIGVGGRMWRWCRRNPVVAVLVAAVQIALVTLLVVGVYSNVRISQALQETKKERVEAIKAHRDADNARIEAEKAKNAAIAETYRARFSETQALRLAGFSGWQHEALDKLHGLAGLDTPQRDLVALRSEAIACMGGFDAVEVMRLRGHRSGVWSLDVSHDGALLLTQDYEGSLRLWDVNEGRHIRAWVDRQARTARQYTNNAPLPVVRFRPGTHSFVSSGWRYAVTEMHPQRSVIGSIRPTSPAFARNVAYDRNGQLLAISWNNGKISIHDAASGAMRREITTPARAWYLPVAVSPDASQIASAGAGNNVLIHPAGGGQPTVLGRHRQPIRALAFSPDGTQIASGSEDQTVRLWFVDGSEESISLVGHTARVNAVAFSPDGSLVASASDDATVRLWDRRTGRNLMVLRPNIGVLLSVAFTPDGSHVVAACMEVCVYRLTTRREQRRLAGHTYTVRSLSFHPRRPLLASGSADRQVFLWDAGEGRILRRWRQERHNPVSQIAYSPDGQHLACGVARFSSGTSKDYGIDIWNAETGANLGRLAGPTTAITALAFDANGQTLLAGSDLGELVVWQIPGGLLRRRWKETKAIAGASFLSPDAVVVGLQGGEVKVMGVSDQKVRYMNDHVGAVTRVVASPSAKLLAVGNSSGIVHLLTSNLSSQAELRGHTGAITALAFSRDGRLLATGGPTTREYAVIIWDVARREQLFNLPQMNMIHSLAFDADGLYLAIGGSDELITLWNFSLVRPELASLDLDWDRTSTTRPARPAATTVRVVESPRLASTPTAGRGWDTGRSQEVLRNWQRSIITRPTDRDLYTGLGRSAMAVGDYAQAASAFEKHLALCKDCPIALANLAISKIALEDYAAAIRFGERYQAAHATRAEPCSSLAWLYIDGPESLRNPDKALLLARRGQTLAPVDPMALMVLGAVYHRQGQFENAIETLGRVSSGNRLAWTLAQLFLAMSEQEMGNPEAAKKAFHRAGGWWKIENIHPNLMNRWLAIHAEAARKLDLPSTLTVDGIDDRLLRGKALVRMLRWKEAWEDLSEVVKERPDDAELHDLCARTCAHKGEHRQAATHFAKALDLLARDKLPNAPEFTIIYGDLPSFPEVCEQLLKLRPTDDRLWLGRARHRACQEQWNEAAADYARAKPDRPVREDRVEQLALALVRGDHKEHEQLLKALMRDAGEKPTGVALTCLVWGSALSASPDVRIEPFLAVLDKMAGTNQNRRARALAHYRLGRFPEAQKLLAQLGTGGMQDLLLALIQAKQGNRDAGQTAYERATKWLDERKPQANAPVEMPTLEWLTVMLLRREAEIVFGRQ